MLLLLVYHELVRLERIFSEDFLGGFLCHYLTETVEVKTGNWTERGGTTCSRGPRHAVAAAED